jgi:hypothetical protein
VGKINIGGGTTLASWSCFDGYDLAVWCPASSAEISYARIDSLSRANRFRTVDEDSRGSVVKEVLIAIADHRNGIYLVNISANCIVGKLSHEGRMKPKHNIFFGNTEAD